MNPEELNVDIPHLQTKSYSKWPLNSSFSASLATPWGVILEATIGQMAGFNDLKQVVFTEGMIESWFRPCNSWTFELTYLNFPLDMSTSPKSLFKLSCLAEWDSCDQLFSPASISLPKSLIPNHQAIAEAKNWNNPRHPTSFSHTEPQPLNAEPQEMWMVFKLTQILTLCVTGCLGIMQQTASPKTKLATKGRWSGRHHNK